MSIHIWKHLSSRTILDHPRLKLMEDEVELPNGTITSYLKEAPAAKPSVTIIALNDNAEILLQKEYSYPPNEVMWQLPGGAVEANEDILQAAKRELVEESDLLAQHSKLLGYYYTNNRRSDQKQYVVVCKNLSVKKGTRDAEEFIESEWVPISELASMIAAGEFTNINLLAALNLWTHLSC